MKTIKIILAALTISFLATSCSSSDPEPVNEEELITTLTLTLTPQTGNVVTLKSVDLDGADGPNAPVITVSGNLAANMMYTGAVEVLNEAENPAEDITIEVRAEANEHEFFYVSTVSGIAISKTDTDSNGNPLGIETSFTTGIAGTGSLTVTLKHEPTKPNNNTTTDAGGETDVEATFSVTVQ